MIFFNRSLKQERTHCECVVKFTYTGCNVWHVLSRVLMGPTGKEIMPYKVLCPCRTLGLRATIKILKAFDGTKERSCKRRTYLLQSFLSRQNVSVSERKVENFNLWSGHCVGKLWSLGSPRVRVRDTRHELRTGRGRAGDG